MRSKLKTKWGITDHPRKVEKGDILICEKSDNGSLIHCAMYIGKNTYIESMPGYGVMRLHKNLRPWFWDKYQFLYAEKIWNPNTEYNREEIINYAIEWAIDQKLSRYQYWHDGYDKTSNYNPEDPFDDQSKRWICSELIWAAYMNASDEKINISNAVIKPGATSPTQYTFVSVDSLKKSGELAPFLPINPPLAARVKWKYLNKYWRITEPQI
jgi:uncharacterized protein YycO